MEKVSAGGAGGGTSGGGGAASFTLAVPKFECGLTITTPSLVVDRDGYAWWVNPELQIIKPAVR